MQTGVKGAGVCWAQFFCNKLYMYIYTNGACMILQTHDLPLFKSFR